ncbi:MAG: radical SAM protein [Pseudomonadota bacterium]
MKDNNRVLLIHPPVVRPSEPPPGLARLAGALKRADVDCEVVDANIEGLLYLLRCPIDAKDTWTRRAVSHLAQNLTAMQSPATYAGIDRYGQVVSELNRVLAQQVKAMGFQIQLANYQDPKRAPVNSRELIAAFESPEETPFFPYFEKRLSELMAKKRFGIAGISVNFLTQALCAFAIIGVVRRLDPVARIFVGGGLITSWMKRPDWKNPFSGIIDELVCGPGEEALLSALNLKGTGGEPAVPDFTHFPARSYLSPGLVIPFAASTGCYWRRCVFCPEQAEKNPYRPIPPKEVVSQLQGLVRDYRPSLLHLTDNAISPALLSALTKNPPGAPWHGFARVTGALADSDFCRALKRSGCALLQIGLESGSQKVLDAFGKGIEVGLAEKALYHLTQAGIATYVYLLFGTPWETEADAEKTLRFTVKESSSISFLNLAVFNLPAHGPEAGDLITGAIDEGDLFLYQRFEHRSGWTRPKVRQFLDKRFRRHPAIGSILRRDPPVFTSNHAPFFNIS